MVTSINPSAGQPYLPPEPEPTKSSHEHQANQAPAQHAGASQVGPTASTQQAGTVQPMQLIEEVHKGGGGGHKKNVADKIQEIEPGGGKKLFRAQMRYSTAEATRRQALEDLKKLEKEKKVLLTRKKKDEEQKKEDEKKKKGKENQQKKK